MHIRHPSHPLYDVIIAGAGPVGLFLACELGLAGLSVLLLEQAEHPASFLKQLPFGLRGLSVPSLEALQRRALLDAVAPDMCAQVGGASSRRPGGHFAGIQFFLDDVDTARWSYRLPGAFTSPASVTMARLEAALTARALALGVTIERGCGVHTVAPGDDTVRVYAGGQVFSGRWLVGCDGGRSTVRKLCDFAFAGTEPALTGYSADVTLGDPAERQLAAGRHATPTGMYSFQPPGFVSIADFDGGAFHRSAAITREHVEATLRRVSGTDVTLTALHRSATWTDRACQASTYRQGRVLLAGDAAHIHSPLGGQGLNLGLGDAMNLGWKLAATVRGTAPAALLDSYTAERHPVGAQVLAWSRAQVALMRPTPGATAMAAITRDLMATRDGATFFAERAWGAMLRYDLGDGHPLVGRSAPDFVLDGGSALSACLQPGNAVLLDFSASAALRGLAQSWSGRLVYVATGAQDCLGLTALLVRPDGVVACASDGVPDPAQFARAASRWLGAPVQR
ncbi:FAD-dependent oxidoreductase [Duganella sp. Leaf126]|uniref:FAD-dependent monooxygenase n=1 Tax=Duganella sp. Leaf126 TaxID=1736266 RepID=UPI0006FFA7C4|nr:FAD-dependent monooxygenase [Duganella sp. Leaf126]KQQ44646.1 FAD-dependent oxidoreductase [Duganella sp. Leaf126]